jgi:hypothetical protein
MTLTYCRVLSFFPDVTSTCENARSVRHALVPIRVNLSFSGTCLAPQIVKWVRDEAIHRVV